MPCGHLKFSRRFEGIYRLRLQGLTITEAGKQHEAASKLHLKRFTLTKKAFCRPIVCSITILRF
jgi:hypothetical protein